MSRTRRAVKVRVDAGRLVRLYGGVYAVGQALGIPVSRVTWGDLQNDADLALELESTRAAPAPTAGRVNCRPIDEWARQQIASLELRVADLERRLGGGQRAAGAAADAGEVEADPEVVRLLREGSQVQAVAHVVKQKGSSLTEAKAEVDRVKAQLSL